MSFFTAANAADFQQQLRSALSQHLDEAKRSQVALSSFLPLSRWKNW